MLRTYFPEIKSILMDFKTYNTFIQYAVAGTISSVENLTHLTKEEAELYQYILTRPEKNRLEQERIPHIYVERVFEEVLNRDN